MRKTKIRGHNSKHRKIESWRLNNLKLNLDVLEEFNREYVKITVSPWSDLSIFANAKPQPKGKTKQIILSALFDIYDSWNLQLQSIGKPYYLKIWIFEPRFSKSQVVCAIDESINFYKNCFLNQDNTNNINPDNYGKIKNRFDNFEWEYGIDEDHFDNTDLGKPNEYLNQTDYEESKRWFEKLLTKPHRKVNLENPIGDVTETYSFKRGIVWIGSKIDY